MENTHSTARKKKSMRWVKRLFIFVLFCVLIGGIILLGLVAYISKDLPDPDKLINRQVEQSTIIYDRTGEHVLYEIHGDKQRTVVKLEEVPKYAIWAVVALEDKNFYKHGGLSYPRMIKAVIDYAGNKLFHTSLSGGSTLTQQLVKNAILTPERTVWRKFKEIVLTIQIERKFTKDQILQMYFNEIPYGATAYGIESAAQLYFGKSASELTLSEGAVLASIINLPTYYFNNQDELMARKDLALKLMWEQGYITESEYKTGLEEQIDFRKHVEDIKAPHFVMYVRERLTRTFGEKLVEQGGLKVITTLDYDMQMDAERIVSKWAERNEQFDATNAALLALDPANGHILAMVGSRDYFDSENDGNFNVTLSLRQPGSSFKPIVYAAALEKGYPPETTLFDVETTFKTDIKDYTPHNYDLVEHGPVTLRAALAGSLNIPAVKLIYLTGVERVLDFAEKLGYTSFLDRSRFGLSLVLGGGEVTMLDHVSAYGTFAQDGVWHQPASIISVQDPKGKSLYEYEDKQHRAVAENIARTLNQMLSDNNARAYVFGLNSQLSLGDRPVAAKTGTTNDYRDAWTIGYTPSLAVGVWAGNNDNSKMKKGAGGISVAAPIWNEFMKAVLKDKPKEQFVAPTPIEGNKPVLQGQGYAETTINIDTVTGKVATAYTPPELVEERVYKEAHNILHYIYKDNPLADSPKEPETADVQYVNWEAGVQTWLQKKTEECLQKAAEDPLKTEAQPSDVCVLYNQQLPTEVDDVHVPANRPEIQFVYPLDNQTITDSVLRITVQTSAPRGVNHVDYFLDDQPIGSSSTYPFNHEFNLMNMNNGFYTLKAIAYDDVKNSEFVQSLVNINIPARPVSVTWVGPKNNATYLRSHFPLSIQFYITQSDKVSEINIYRRNADGEDLLIATIIDGIQESVTAQWKTAPAPGTYTLYPVIRTIDGGDTIGEGITVYVQN